ncbi:MAG: serine acetyltransferase [Clostridia bacterium]|nr:serine acetyltransferase [Clostridia bacterium]
MTDISKIAKEMANSYDSSAISAVKNELALPDKNEIISVLDDIKKLFFPSYFASGEVRGDSVGFADTLLHSIYGKIKKQISLSLSYKEKKSLTEHAEQIASRFIERLPEIHKILLTDIEASFEGDPAAQSKEEIVFCYPGFNAILIYRVAHLLYEERVPFIPRVMTEYAHSLTGIDINPGATIGEYFFIDHGTGIVIGETTVIGKRVRLYQGVTLGALSPRKGQVLSGVKRHPTIKDGATIYSGASILGGDTVIGEGAVIGGNSFITESVADGARVSIKTPELIIKDTKK